MGYCPFFFSKFESQYIKLYCDTEPGRHGLGDRPGRAAGAQRRAVARHDMAWSGWDMRARAMTRLTRAQGRATTRARDLAGEGVAIQTLYRGWGAALCCDTTCDTAAIRRLAPCDMLDSAHDTARGRDLCRDTILYRDWGRR